METILRKLRRSNKKEEHIEEIDAIDEESWAQAKTLDFEDDSYNYKSNTKYKKNNNKIEKREDIPEDIYLENDELENSNNNINENYYINSISLLNEYLHNVSTDITKEYYIKKGNKYYNKYQNGNTNRGEYAQKMFDKCVCETKEYSEIDNEMNMLEEASIERIKIKKLNKKRQQVKEVLEEDDDIDEGEDYEIEDYEIEEVENNDYKYIEDTIELYDKENDEIFEQNQTDNNNNENLVENKEEIVNEAEEDEKYVEEKLDIYTNEQIDNEVEIAHIKGKGRCMFTRKELNPGNIIFIEKPLLIIIPSLNETLWEILNNLNNEQPFELPLRWHYAALCTITMLNDDDFNACIDKWIPEPDKDPDDDVFNVLDKVCDIKTTKSGGKYYYYKNKLIDPNIYDRIIQVWHYNAFGHHTDSEGLVLYNRISMLAHSCNSTACWHYGENDSFVLRARVKLNVGDELTISYLGDDDLYKSSNIRREKLTNWLFVCMCNRCSNPVDYSRGFKCATCGIGTFFIKSEYNCETPIITKCNICLSEITESTALEYIEYENSYIERLEETNKNDLADALAVYIQAEKIFTQHWVMYQLYTILFEGYRDSCEWGKAIYYQMQRIRYAIEVIPRANYVLAWLYEELGEAHANSINTGILATEDDYKITYEEKKRICSFFLRSIHLLEILCGYSHDYLKDSLNKYYRIEGLTATDALQTDE
ncbi:SET domain protein, putative [Plasmodium berghei]|uniref:Histone-lysine N-methyltransferase SET7, putative n=2 Tax=Plasmodium berghei TaxID=5821 RepID=A0A509AM27_PLABA|nr:SET domain-containing protein 7, putative [Plasmodium berghei ANKA]CXI44859.1 SET domain protein, putative [Plasmodium berghei]SCM22569.1 SET domain protein, putative [Plasmodium berghei]SCN25524.1 SET domain protein, putative [Plasmodium berghei]SCO60481.1 SET domain protein, putative [Plasmodium berghei]SCO62261.1 SET domain protein, putative [Plasmodium berghei]|eukprot:XP_034421675.1 SET domain-containing protein 7, putative [Plasmodium berghei ANKA]